MEKRRDELSLSAYLRGAEMSVRRVYAAYAYHIYSQ